MICPECGSEFILQYNDDVCECQECGEAFYEEEAHDLSDEDIDDLIEFADAEPDPDLVLDLPDVAEMDELEQDFWHRLLDDLRGGHQD